MVDLLDAKKLENDVCESLVRLIELHIIGESGDGDAAVLFKYRKKMLPKVRDSLISKINYLHIENEGEGFCYLSDKSNESILLTTNEEVFNGYPSWIMLKIQV